MDKIKELMNGVKSLIKASIRSKTMIFGFALTVFGVLEVNMSFFQTLMNEKTFGYFTIFIGLAIKVLRFVTKTSLDDKIAEAMSQTEKT